MALFLTGSLPSGATVSVAWSRHPPHTLPHTLRQQQLRVSTAPGHVACGILKGQMTQTNNGLGEALLGLAGAVLVTGRISAGGLLAFLLVLNMVYDCQGQYSVCTCLTTVTLYLCGYISVPRQAFSELFCNKDTERIVVKCFILCSTAKDVCSHKIVLGHPSREDDYVQKKNKYAVEVLLIKM